ncbi:MAG: hypothetical protein AAF557_25445 [Pseudomonadota bacterium]
MLAKGSYLKSTIMKLLGVFILGSVLSACADPIPKSAITPVYKGQAPQKLSIGMTDQRSFILDGNKEEWFEGILHGAYGIPASLKRPGPKEGQPFTMYLSSMLADGLRTNGTNAPVVRIARGVSKADAVKTVIDAHGTPGIIFEIFQSRYSVAWTRAEYNFNYNVIIADQTGEIVLEKKFARFDTSIPLSDKYTIFDMYAEIYKMRLDEVLKDPEVVEALSSLAQPSA